MHSASECIDNVIAQYGMPDKVQMLEENYKNLVLPFPTRKDYMLDIRTSWSLSDYIDVVMTFSPVNNLIKSLGLTLEEGYVHVTDMIKEGALTEVDMESVYTWNQPCAIVTATKPLN